MHAVVATAGPANARFDAWRASAASRGMQLRELTDPSAPARVGVIGRSGSVLDHESAGGAVCAVLGSSVGIPRARERVAARVLDALRRTGGLDDLPDDLAVVAAGVPTGPLVLAHGGGNHRVFAWEAPDGGTLASTHVGLLAEAAGPDLRVDRSREDFLLGFGFLPGGGPPYAGMRALPARTIEATGRPAASLPPPPAMQVDPGHEPAAVRAALHDLLLEVVEEQSAGRSRHAVLLGGFDSMLVAALLRRLGHEVDTYTFGFGDPRYEQRHVERLSGQIGARHAWVRITPDAVGAGLRDFSDRFNQPGPQPHYQLHTELASRGIAADGHDLAFSGDGCDAAFLGYPMVNQRASIVERMRRVPRPARRALHAVASRRAVERRLGHVARQARFVLHNAELPALVGGHLPSCYLDDVALARLRRGASPEQAAGVDEIRDELAGDLGHLDRVRLAFHGNGLVGQSRTKVEGSVACSGVAQCSPYLDRRVKGLAASLPTEMLRPEGTRAASSGKTVLVDMAREHRLLPDDVIDMPKQSPVDSPIDEWYAGPLRGLVTEMLADLPFEVDGRYVDEILTPKWAEDRYRDRVSLGHHAFQAIGLLCSYAAFTARAR